MSDDERKPTEEELRQAAKRIFGPLTSILNPHLLGSKAIGGVSSAKTCDNVSGLRDEAQTFTSGSKKVGASG